MHGGMPTRLKRIARALGGGRLQSRLLADERGIALVVALGILVVLTILGTSVFSYSTINAHSTRLSQERSTAWTIAEAGVSQAYSILGNPTNDVRKAGLLTCTGVSCTPCGSASCFTTTVPGGYALWSGRLVPSAVPDARSCVDPNDAAYDPSTCPYWIVTSTGYVRNPDASTSASKTAIVKVTLTPTPLPPLDARAWNQIMATHPPSAVGVCDETINNGGNITSPLYVMGNLCLQNTVSVLQAPLNVVGSIMLGQPQTTVGTNSSPLPNGTGGSVHIGGQCAYSQNVGGAYHTCGSAGGWAADHIFAVNPDNSPDLTITPPVINWAGWYLNASPGPKFPCGIPGAPVVGTPPLFDGADDATDGGGPDNDLWSTPVNLTPAASYTCKTDYGELSWNKLSNVLTINGAVFIDGSAYINGGSGNFHATYAGRGVLYLMGNFFMQSAVLCASNPPTSTQLINPNGQNWDCTNTGWNPDTALFAIVTQGYNGQPGNSSMPLTDGVFLKSATFQGAAYGVHDVQTDTSSKFYGPMLGNKVIIGQSVNTQFPQVHIQDFAFNQNGNPPLKVNAVQYLNG
jgi:hypothetical protein